MSLAVLHSRARDGIDAPLVTVEVHIANGLPALSIVVYINTFVLSSYITTSYDAYHGG